MKDAWPKMMTPEAPRSHRIVENGDAKRPRIAVAAKRPVYSWDEVKVVEPDHTVRPNVLGYKN